MWRVLTFISLLQLVAGYSKQLCDSNQTRSCTFQNLGEEHDYNVCKIQSFAPNSNTCLNMNFGPLESNTQIGGIRLKPYILSETIFENAFDNYVNYTILNITFSNIKWKTMKFRFQVNKQNKNDKSENHCTNIVIPHNVTMNDQSVLYYDCFWAYSTGFEGLSHILEFEATDDNVVNTGRYYFNMPSDKILNPALTETRWTPFTYIEMLPHTMRVHVMSPPNHLKINAYQIQVIKESDKNSPREIVDNTTLTFKNTTDEVTYDYMWLRGSGMHYFVITPLHENCKSAGGPLCQSVATPKVLISTEEKTLNICIASVVALIVATLFAYYIMLRLLRRYWCKGYYMPTGNDIPPPTKVLAVYSSNNRLHAKCVASFVNYLRLEYGLDVMYDGDIPSTSHRDPQMWAGEAFAYASHIMYIVGTTEEKNQYNIYDGPVNAHRNLDLLILSYLAQNQATRRSKEVLNVFFDYSNGPLPKETRHDKVFFLLKDWNKLISYLSKNLLPKKQIMRTDKGKCFIDDLNSAKKLLIDSGIQYNV